MPENPNQMSFSFPPEQGRLKLGYDEDDPVVRSFQDEIADLRKSMAELVETNRNLLKALGQQFAPNVSQASTATKAAQASEPAAQQALFNQQGTATYPLSEPPVDNASTPNKVRSALGTISRGVDRFNNIVGHHGPGPRSAGEEDLIEQGTGFGGPSVPGGGGASRPASSDLPPWLRSLGQRSDAPFSMPRYGEFNAQDIFGLAAQALGKLSVNSETGKLKDGNFASAAGRIGGLFNTAADVVPYFKAAGQMLESHLGMAIGPGSIKAQTSALGYNVHKMSTFGPFSLPFSEFKNSGFQELKQEDLTALKLGATLPNLSIKDVRAIQESLKSQGYSGRDLERMTGVIARVKSDKTLGNIGSDETTAALADQFIRNQAGSISDLKDALRPLGDLAIKARLGVDELKSSLISFSESQQQIGATKPQGVFTGEAFTAMTGLDPRILQEFQQNGFFQANLTTSTGLLPFQQGLAPAGDQVNAMYRTLHMLRGAFQGIGGNVKKTRLPAQYGGGLVGGASGEDAVNAAIASQTGMTPDVISKLFRDEKKNRIGAYLTEGFQTYTQAAGAIANNAGLSPGERRSRLAALDRGIGDGGVSRSNLDRMMHDAGIKDTSAVWKDRDPTDRINVMEKLLAGVNPSRTDQGPKVWVGLSPEARKALRIGTDPNKILGNNAEIRINANAGTQAMPGVAYGGKGGYVG